MKEETKLQTYFNAFSKKDWKQFKLFLDSPFFNTTTSCNRLFEFFNKSQTQIQGNKLSRQEVFEYVFQNKNFKDGQLRTLFWRMAKLVEKYLAVSTLAENPDAMEDQLIQALGKRNEWFKLFEKKIHIKTKKAQEKSVDFTALLQSVIFHHELYFHGDFQRYGSGYLEIRRLVGNLDQFIILAKLRYHCELLFRRQILKEEEEHPFPPDPILDQLLKSGILDKEEPMVKIYAQLILMKQSGDLKSYRKAKKYFEQIINIIDPKDQQDILFYLQNFIIYLNKRQGKSLYEEMMDLYQLGLDSEILVINNRITYETFTNVTILASSLKKFTWTDSFIRKYQKMLEPTKASLAIKLARAYWNFHQNKFEEVLDWTQEIEIHEEKPDYSFRLRALKLRAFYELYLENKSYRRVLYNFIESFTKYIKNNQKYSKQQATGYLNFVRITKLLINLTIYESSEEQKQKLLSKVAETNPLVLKSWIMEKIEDN